jgi:hypothetical protein
VLAILIGVCGVILTALVAAVAVKAITAPQAMSDTRGTAPVAGAPKPE